MKKEVKLFIINYKVYEVADAKLRGAAKKLINESKLLLNYSR